MKLQPLIFHCALDLMFKVLHDVYFNVHTHTNAPLLVKLYGCVKGWEAIAFDVEGIGILGVQSVFNVC